MYVIVNARGEVERDIGSDSLSVAQAVVDLNYPKHTPIFTTADASSADPAERLPNPPATPAVSMAASGLPWRPNAKRPGVNARSDERGVGITMAEVLKKYPLDANGLERAWQCLLAYFPNTPEEHGFSQWGKSANTMARKMLKSNAKTAKAVQGVAGMVLPSYAVGINLLPAGYAAKRSVEPRSVVEPAYYARKGAPEMPIFFDTVPGGPFPDKLGNKDTLGLGAGRRLTMVDHGRRLVTLCAGSSTDCRSTCLVTTGQNAAVAYNDYSKLFMTRALFFEPLAFARMLMAAVGFHVDHCRKGVSFEPRKPPIKCLPYLRMNVYSDICWELFFPEFFDYCASAYPDLSIYDYSKVPGRGPKPKPNYDLTFSYSGVNLAECKAALKSKMRIAVVFLRRTAQGSSHPAEEVRDIVFFSPKKKTPAGVFAGYPVIDGDLYDMRSEDPAPVVVGLRYKIPQKIEVDQRILLHNGTELVGKITSKTANNMIRIKLKATDGKRAKNIDVSPLDIEKIGQGFVLSPPSHTAKFLVNAHEQDGQWIYGVTPQQTGSELDVEVNEEVA